MRHDTPRTIWLVLLGVWCGVGCHGRGPTPIDEGHLGATSVTASPTTAEKGLSQPGPRATTPPPPTSPLPRQTGPDFVRVFERVSPSVVSVVAGRLRDGRFRPERTGTGFVWDTVGHVVTSDHLVGDAPVLRVRTFDGRVLKATLVGQDGPTDLAVLAVKAKGLAPAPRRSAESLRPGQWLAAIGNPHGLQHSITVGVVSALGRHDLPGGTLRYADFIQTDLSINPGNSGGPLVDASGAIVGLNTAMVGRAQGLSFATPIDMVETVVGAVLREGRFVRGFAGIYTKAVSRKAADAAGLDRGQGARVKGVVADGPAARAGILPGDIVLSLDDHPITDSRDLPWLIAASSPGSVVVASLARGRLRMDVQLKVGRAR